MQQCDQELSSKYWWPDWQRSDHIFCRKHDAYLASCCCL